MSRSGPWLVLAVAAAACVLVMVLGRGRYQSPRQRMAALEANARSQAAAVRRSHLTELPGRDPDNYWREIRTEPRPGLPDPVAAELARRRGWAAALRASDDNVEAVLQRYAARGCHTVDS